MKHQPALATLTALGLLLAVGGLMLAAAIDLHDTRPGHDAEWLFAQVCPHTEATMSHTLVNHPQDPQTFFEVCANEEKARK